MIHYDMTIGEERIIAIFEDQVYAVRFIINANQYQVTMLPDEFGALLILISADNLSPTFNNTIPEELYTKCVETVEKYFDDETADSGSCEYPPSTFAPYN